jgi:hypothetical protein
MAELQQLMAEMGQLVQEQGEVIDNVEKTTAAVADDTEKGYVRIIALDSDFNEALIRSAGWYKLPKRDTGRKKLERNESCASGSSL